MVSLVIKNNKKNFNDVSSKNKPLANILVVEDDEGLNLLIQKKLQRENFRTDGVLSGADAILKN